MSMFCARIPIHHRDGRADVHPINLDFFGSVTERDKKQTWEQIKNKSSFNVLIDEDAFCYVKEILLFLLCTLGCSGSMHKLSLFSRTGRSFSRRSDMPGYYICRELIKNKIFGKRFNIRRRLPGRLRNEHVSPYRKTAQISEVISIRDVALNSDILQVIATTFSSKYHFQPNLFLTFLNSFL